MILNNPLYFFWFGDKSLPRVKQRDVKSDTAGRSDPLACSCVGSRVWRSAAASVSCSDVCKSICEHDKHLVLMDERPISHADMPSFSVLGEIKRPWDKAHICQETSERAERNPARAHAAFIFLYMKELSSNFIASNAQRSARHAHYTNSTKYSEADINLWFLT